MRQRPRYERARRAAGQVLSRQSAGASDLGVHLSSAAIENPNRRDFLFIATGAVAAVGAAAVAWPLIDQMNPDASTLALASIEVDLGAIPEGQIVTVKWRGGPVFVRHRTQKEIDEAVNTPLSELQAIRRPTGARPEGRVADRRRRLHASGLRAARPRGPIRRLEVPVPWVGLRHLRAHPPRPRAAQSRTCPNTRSSADTKVKIG